MIAGHFTLWVKNQTGIHWLVSKALPELGTALPQLVYIFIQKTELYMKLHVGFKKLVKFG